MNWFLNLREICILTYTCVMFAFRCLCFHCEHFSIFMIPLCKCYPNGFNLFVFQTIFKCSKIPFSHSHLIFALGRITTSFSLRVIFVVPILWKCNRFEAKRNYVNRIRIQEKMFIRQPWTEFVSDFGLSVKCFPNKRMTM